MLAKPLHMYLVCLIQVPTGHRLKLNPLDMIYIKQNTSNISFWETKAQNIRKYSIYIFYWVCSSTKIWEKILLYDTLSLKNMSIIIFKRTYSCQWVFYYLIVVNHCIITFKLNRFNKTKQIGTLLGSFIPHWRSIKSKGITVFFTAHKGHPPQDGSFILFSYQNSHMTCC